MYLYMQKHGGNLKMCFVKESNHKIWYIKFHLYELFRIDKSIESGLVAAYGWEIWSKWEVIANEYRFRIL
jgi:hypothetical protein